MDPLAVGERVLQAIHRNEPYIFPHGEFKQELAEYFQRMLDAFPDDQEIEPQRREMEARRAKMTAEMRQAADSIDN